MDKGPWTVMNKTIKPPPGATMHDYVSIGYIPSVDKDMSLTLCSGIYNHPCNDLPVWATALQYFNIFRLAASHTQVDTCCPREIVTTLLACRGNRVMASLTLLRLLRATPRDIASYKVLCKFLARHCTSATSLRQCATALRPKARNTFGRGFLMTTQR